MRIIAAIVLFVAAGAPVAWAQQGSSSPKTEKASNAADAKAANPAGASAPGPATAPATPATPAPSPPHNFSVNGSSVIPALPPPTAEEAKAEAAAQAAWQARCHPVVIEDPDGLQRVHYAARDCDLSTANTAGIR